MVELALARARARQWGFAAAATALASLGAGCGYADSGDGTKTLGVVATLRCGYPELLTRAEFAISEPAGTVSAAVVTLTDGDTNESVEVAETSEPGHYAASWPGYHRRVKASVWRGKDGMRFQVEAPSPHLLLAPAPGTWLKQAQILEVRWRSPDGLRADRVDVHVDGQGGQAGAPDAEATGGTVSRDAGRAHVRLEDVAAGAHTLQVARTSTLVPAGARPGASVESTYAVDTAFYKR